MMEVAVPTEDARQGGCLPAARCRETSFRGDVRTIVSGTTVAQVLLLVSAPLLTRLYEPQAFGVFAVFISMSTVLGAIACMRYEMAIMLPESDQEAANVLGVGLASATIISVVLVPIVWAIRGPVSQLLNAPQLSSYLWFLPASVFFTGVFSALNYWNSRTKHFGRLSVARVMQSICTLSAQLGGACAGIATGGMLVGGQVIGQTVATAALGVQILRNDAGLMLGSISVRKMLSAINRYRRFPLYSVGSGLLNTLSWQIPSLLLAAFFSDEIVGQYALGFRILQMPGSLIGVAIAQVFFQRASVARNSGGLPAVTETTLRNLLKVGLFPASLLMVAGGDLFTLVFGERWTEAGLYAQILAPWTLFLFIQSPISSLFVVLEKQRTLLLCDIVTVVIRALSLIIGGMLGSSVLALALFSGIGTAINLVMLVYLLSLVGCPVNRFARDFVTMMASIGLFLIPVVVAQLVHASVGAIVLLGLGSSVAYYILMLVRDEASRHVLLRAISVHGIRKWTR